MCIPGLTPAVAAAYAAAGAGARPVLRSVQVVGPPASNAAPQEPAAEVRSAPRVTVMEGRA
jgi:hypothetical protein